VPRLLATYDEGVRAALRSPKACGSKVNPIRPEVLLLLQPKESLYARDGYGNAMPFQ
jgi:hypothetical protein